MNKNLFVLILTLITAIYYFPTINFPVSAIDESFILVGAERIARGEIPHKDFSSEYPAGQYYVLAAFFKMFGTSVTSERIYDILVKTLLSMVIFLTIRLLSSTGFAMAGWLMSLIWIQHKPAMAYSVYPAMLFIYLSVYCTLLHFKHKKNLYIVLSAIFTVSAVLFRHDLGGFTAIATAIVLLINKFRDRHLWTSLALYISGVIIAALPVIFYLFTFSDIAVTVNDLILIPLAYMEHEAIPYPRFSRWYLPFYIFPLVIITGIITSFIYIKSKTSAAKVYAILLISLIGAFCFDRIRVRPDTPHLLPVALTGIMLAPIILCALIEQISLSVRQKVIVYVLFVVVFGISLSRPVEIIGMILSRSNGYVVKNMNPDIERAKHQPISEDIKKVVSYIKMNTSINDYIYVGVKNHDQFVFNDILIYFLADRNYVSRYHGLSPGVQTTSKVQMEIINEFKKNQPRIVVLGSRSWYGSNQSGIDSKVDLLDNYISNNFELTKIYGSYEIWMLPAT